MKSNKRFHLILLVMLLSILIWSVIEPKDLFIWFLEVLPVIIGVSVLICIYPKYRFSNFIYVLITIESIILIVGGHYTYAEMPIFNWIRDTFDLSRNYYDRLGHFMQGFIPAMIAREIIIRNKVINKKKYLSFIVICICLAISASYELIEFVVAKLTGNAADAFLGTQGDVWDTQWDMLMALIGSVTSLSLFSRYHDKKLAQLNNL
ncbi:MULTISPECIES: DUF2238 domain-containing protein [Clostridium]|uniref:DUF2238 domain-containing protein n=1 Tax=Clostridium TaxID=1485 RepID=UPI0002C98375|nr:MULTISPECIES: DUF2238 domain-containing protein [Clostridium]EMU52175.1 membrane protein [Clostridium butyricum DKU-01]ENZ32892.1 hypothetical protein HMPREF1084_02239 [Clostridium butyricum 60E.3]KJZ85839.1 putative sodium-glucose/galactose cotransporter [Clostridium sp. IBUN22A]KJZ88749.1 putative sodium-glucose/galactose cotransporter [Clostridium sp. IBUN125C]KJZ94378.1 hypothetical protein ClosIBUN13A_CONTIG188g03026 [Clostridium sp. IBUN13A]